jgi:hypothetical protein
MDPHFCPLPKYEKIKGILRHLSCYTNVCLNFMSLSPHVVQFCANLQSLLMVALLFVETLLNLFSFYQF